MWVKRYKNAFDLLSNTSNRAFFARLNPRYVRDRVDIWSNELIKSAEEKRRSVSFMIDLAPVARRTRREGNRRWSSCRDHKIQSRVPRKRATGLSFGACLLIKSGTRDSGIGGSGGEGDADETTGGVPARNRREWKHRRRVNRPYLCVPFSFGNPHREG